MIVDEAKIDTLVRQVLARLEQAGANGSAGDPQAHTSDLIVDGRLVTLDALEGKLSDKQRVVVGQRAVVTPAVHDELRDRQIELVRCNRHAADSAQKELNAAEKLIVGAPDRTLAIAAVRSLEEKHSIVAATNMAELVRELGRRIANSSDARGVLLTEQPVAALCLANRHRQIRAAAAVDQATVFEAARTISANLFVVDTRCVCGLQLNRIVEAVSTSEVKPYSRELRQALEQAS